MSAAYWLAIGLAALATSESASASAAQNTPARLDAVDIFALAGRAAAAGKVDEALTLYDALARNPDLEVRSEARFRRGQLLAANHRYREAAATYRRLLDEKPEAARVRLELAAMLARLGDEPGARRQLRLAQAAGLPPDVADQVSQFSRALRSSKRLGGTFDLALAPDTNINRGTQARTLDTVIAPLLLSEDARATSGVGLRTRASGFAKQSLTGRISLVARAAGAADFYRRADANDLLASGQFGLEWRGREDQVSTAYGISQRWYGGEAFAHTRSVTAEWLRQLDRVTQLSANVSRGAIRYRRNPLQDGTLYDGGFTVERALSAKMGVALGAGATRQEALDPSYASWAYGPIAYSWRDWGRTTLFGTLAVRRLIGDERNFLFTDKRREWFVSGRVGAIFRQLSVSGFSPTMRLGLERNKSTVSIYDYRRVYAEAGITRSF